MARKVLGSEMSVLYDSSVIAYTTDFDLEVNKETIDVTSLASGSWKEFDVDFKDWGVNFNGLVTRTVADGSANIDYDDLLSQIKTNDSSIRIAIKPTDISGNKFEIGWGLLTSVKASGAVGDKVTFSGSIQGTGTLDSSIVTG